MCASLSLGVNVAYCYAAIRVTRSVVHMCLSIGTWVTDDVCSTAEPIMLPFGGGCLVGSRNRVLDGLHISSSVATGKGTGHLPPSHNPSPVGSSMLHSLTKVLNLCPSLHCRMLDRCQSPYPMRTVCSAVHYGWCLTLSVSTALLTLPT